MSTTTALPIVAAIHILVALTACSREQTCSDWREKDQPRITGCSSFETSSGSFQFNCDGILEAEYGVSGSGGSGNFYIECGSNCLTSVRINGARTESVRPWDGDLDVPADTCIEAELTQHPHCQEVDLTGPFGPVEGTTSVRGSTLSFCPATDLELGFTYFVDIVTDGYEVSTEFGTYGLGAPADGPPMTTGAYLGSPTAYSALRHLGIDTDRHLALEVSGSREDMTLRLGAVQVEGTVPCTATLQLPASWDNPVLGAELAETEWPFPLLGEVRSGAPIRDLVLEATLIPGRNWMALDLSFHADLRQAAGQEHLETLCETSAQAGWACEACDDGEPACIHAEALGIVLDFDEIDTLPDISISEIADDPDCCGDIDASWVYEDLDGDGYGPRDTYMRVCEITAGMTPYPDDCDDADPDVHPDADEYCNDIDDDCDGTIDEDDAVDASTWYSDADGDGYGDPASPLDSCEQPGGYLADQRDCDDAEADVHPAAEEVCNDVDDDCDGLTDDDDDSVTDQIWWYIDMDGDGYGVGEPQILSCDQPSGHGPETGDCDDADATITPVDGCYEGVFDCVHELEIELDYAPLTLRESCSDSFTTTVDWSVSPQFVGEMSCTLAGDVGSFIAHFTGSRELVQDLEGDVVKLPVIGGTVTFATWGASGSWTGDYLNFGAFEGSYGWSASSMDLVGTFTCERTP
jgi:hypothetical protein